MPEIPPLVQGAIRSAGAGLIVWLWARARGIPLHLRDGTLRAGIATGVLFGIEFVADLSRAGLHQREPRGAVSSTPRRSSS